jgi:hypothetical protein
LKVDKQVKKELLYCRIFDRFEPSRSRSKINKKHQSLKKLLAKIEGEEG